MPNRSSARLLNRFQTTLTPNPEKLFRYYSVTKQEPGGQQSESWVKN